MRLGRSHVACEAQLRLAVALVAQHVGIDACIAAARGLPEAHRAIGLPRAHLQKRLRLISLASQVRCLVLFIDDIEAFLEGAAAHRAIGASSDVCVLGRAREWSCIAHDADDLRLRVKLGRSNLDLTVGSRMSTWIVHEVD